jgi:hypothetical protein
MGLKSCPDCGHGHVCNFTPSEENREFLDMLTASINEAISSWERGNSSGIDAARKVRRLLRAANVSPTATPDAPVEGTPSRFFGDDARTVQDSDGTSWVVVSRPLNMTRVRDEVSTSAYRLPPNRIDRINLVPVEEI